MNYTKYIGKIVEVTILDHEQESNVDQKDLDRNKSVEVKVYGQVSAICDDFVVVCPWICDDGNDVYRLLKKCILKVRVLK